MMDGTVSLSPGPAGRRSGVGEGEETRVKLPEAQRGDLRSGIRATLAEHPCGECADLLRLFAVELERAR